MNHRYDFTPQAQMLEAVVSIMDHLGIQKYALGGGTALSACYWQHRFSTDIDIFLFEDKSHLKRIRDCLKDPALAAVLQKINYNGQFKSPGHYLELEIDETKKIQFFEVRQYMATPPQKANLWNQTVYVESVNEIIFKKIYYRANRANARDLFDISIALRKNPAVFEQMAHMNEQFIGKLEVLYDTVLEINNDNRLKNDYLNEVTMMDPQIDDEDFISFSTDYLEDFLSAFFEIYTHDHSNHAIFNKLSETVYKHLHSEGTLV